MVVQRDRPDRATVRFQGTTEAGGRLTATVLQNNRNLARFAKRGVGTASKGAFAGVLRGLPVGGPYDIELVIADARGSARDTLRVRNVLVGDVWMLGGQSNMAGCGLLDPRRILPPNDKVRAFYQDDHWAVARDPLHLPETAKAEVHALIGYAWRTPAVGAGLGVAFGQEMLRLSGGVPQGLIASAHGATSMAQWDPKLKRVGTRSLYGAMLDRLRRNGGTCAGFVWYQGCGETNPADAPLYTRRMIDLVNATRKDFGAPRLPVTIVQLGRFTGEKPADHMPCWNSVRDQQRLLPTKIKRLLTVPALDLELDDAIHIGARDLITLGTRLARAMASMTLGRLERRVFPRRPALSTVEGPEPEAAPLRVAGRFSDGLLLPPIELESVKLTLATNDITVSFKNVVGSLRSAGRPNGFSIVGDGREMPAIVRTELHGAKAVLKTSLSSYLPLLNKSLYYGFGLNPYANIVDEAGRPIPAFGPIELTGRPPATCFFPDVEVSAPLAWPGALEKVGYPKHAAIAFVPSVFQGFYCIAPGTGARKPGVDELHYFRFRFTCAARMPLRLLFGYDGPVKVFVDGREQFADAAGINPITIDEAKFDFAAGKGRHEVVLALGTNKGRAWGICARLDRSDLARWKPGRDITYPEIVKLS